MFRRMIGRIEEWLAQDSEPRRGQRSEQPELLVYYWDGCAPEGRHVRDISQSGAFIYTPERWYVGTMIRIVLQCRGPQRDDGAPAPDVSTCIPARVVRHGPEGVGVEFAFRNGKERKAFQAFLNGLPARAPAAMAPKAWSRHSGQALVEFALIIPLVFVLAVNAANFAGFLFAWITVINASRTASQYMIRSSASPGAPTKATLAQITTLVTADVTSLLNRSSVVVAICTNKTSAANGCTTLVDPEATSYTLATVDITYTYNPLIPLFSFPQMGIAATLPSTSIHRKAVMRMLE